MAGDTFERAKLLHKVISAVGWAGKPEEIAEKVKQLERGLPAEDQFAALCVWMGKCSLIHKLEQEQFPNFSREEYQVPDFLSVFDLQAKRIPTLIEVKKTSGIELEPFGSKYYSKLTNYAKLMALPLLIAWYIEDLNLWCLFDIERMQKKNSAFHIDFHTATNNSLLGAIFNDVIFRIKPGLKIQFILRKDAGTEIRDPTTGKLKQFSGVLEEIAYLNPSDKKIITDPLLSKFLELLFYAVDNDSNDSEDEKYVTINFYTTKEENLFAHQLLGVMAFGTAIMRDTPPTWVQVLRGNSFQMDYQSVRNALSAGVKEGAFGMILRQNPVIRPAFL
jgi:hypothetical protein